MRAQVAADTEGAPAALEDLAPEGAASEVADPEGAAPEVAAPEVVAPGEDATAPVTLASAADWQLAPPGGTLADPTSPAAGDPVWAGAPLEEPVLGSRAARRAAAHDDSISPVRAAAGALVAVAGVALGIGALLWARGDAPQGTPTVSSPVSQPSVAPTAPTTQTAPTPSTAASPTPPVGPSATATAVPSATSTAPAKAPVTVLNNSRRTGLAASAAQRFAAGGWPIRQTGNFTGRVTTTSVYYPPGGEAVARSFARQFGIARVAPRFQGLPGTGLTVVLTRDYRAS